MGGAVDWHEADGGGNTAASYPQLGEQLSAADVANHYRQGIEWLRGLYEQFGLQEHEALALLDMNKWNADNLHDLSDHVVAQLRKEVGALTVPAPGATAEGHICPIEMEVQTAESGVLLACGHCFSTEALSEYIRTEVLESQVPVRCPMHVSGCPLVLSWRETGDLGTQGEGSSQSRVVQSLSSRASFDEVLISKLAPRMAARMGLRQCVSCPSFLHPSPSDWPHLTCSSCLTSFCGHCSHPPHLPLPCEFATMHDEWAGFLDRMTMSAKDLARDPSQETTLSKAQLDAAQAFSHRLDTLLPLPAPSSNLPTSGPTAHSLSPSEPINPEETSGPTKSDEPPTATSEEEDRAAAQAAALREYDLRAETKPCPACGEPYEKNAGCSHFTCKKCGWQFCWVCSKPWKNHSVCAALDVESYGFEEEMEWYRRRSKEADRRVDEEDLEAAKSKRRQQMRDMQRHYVGRVEKENQSMADMRWRRLPQDALGHFLANYEQMGTMLLQGMRAAKTCVRPGYANVAMSAGVTARSMRRIEALQPLAALLERGAMAVMAIDEERGGLSPEHLFNQLEQTRAPGTLDGGFEGEMPGLAEALVSIQEKVMSIERMAVVIMAKESPTTAHRRRHAGGAAVGPRQADGEVAAYLKDGAGMVAEHFDVLSTWAQAWSTVASLVLTHFETLRALRQTVLTNLLLTMGHEGVDAMHMGEREWLGMRHMMMLRERERLLLHRRRDWGDRGLAQRPRDERRDRDEAYAMNRDPYPHRLHTRDPLPPAAYPPMHDRDLPRYGMRGGAEAARPRLLGGYASPLGAGPGPMTREHRTRGSNVTTSATSMSGDTMTTTTSSGGGGQPQQHRPLRHTGFMDMEDDWEVMGMHELEDEMAMFFEDIEAHPPLPPPPPPLPAPDLLPFLHPPDAPMPHPAMQPHHHHQLMMLDMTLEAPRRYLETFQQSVHESEQVDDATRVEFVDLFGDALGAKNLQDGRRAKAAITEAKNRRQFALQRILEGVLSRRRPVQGEDPCTADRISYAQRRESLRERCLLALRAHFERPCASPLPSRRAHPSLFPGLDPQAAELDDDDDRCLDYFRVYELLVHLGVLPAPSMEEDLPARLAYINLIKALDARPRVRSPQSAPEEASQATATHTSSSGKGSGESNGSCGGKRTFDESLLHSPSSANGSLTVKKREAARRRLAGLGGQKQRRADMLTLFTFLQRQEASA